jgi:hypothetical protein
MDWLSIKRQIAEVTVEKDALHIYGAFLVQVLAALVTRRSIASVIPWFAALAAAGLNEGLDLLFEKEPYIQRWQIDGVIHDLVNTMVLPTLLLLLARFAPGVFARPRQDAAAEAAVDQPPKMVDVNAAMEKKTERGS